MKSLTLAFALIFSALHAEAKVCFAAKTAAPSFVPKSICFSSLTVNAVGGYAIIRTEKTKETPKELFVNVFQKHNEERTRFQVTAVLVEPSEIGCFITDSAVAVLNGEINSVSTSAIDASLLTLSVQYNQQTDICHNPRRAGHVEYQLVK